MWTAVFSQGATVMAMIGGSALPPIACRKSTGRIIKERPFAQPAIEGSACAIFAEDSSGSSLLPTVILLAMLQLVELAPLDITISLSSIWLKRVLSLSRGDCQPLLDTSISLLRTILAVTTTIFSGRLLTEPEIGMLLLLVARKFHKPSRRPRRLSSRPTTRTMLGLAGLPIQLVRAVLKRKQLPMLPFARLKGNLSSCLEPLLSMPIPSKSPPRQGEILSKIFHNFCRGEYHSFDLFDRIDVAVVGDANAHTR